MRPVYLSTFEEVYEAYAIVKEGNNTDVLIKSIDEGNVATNPYHVAQFFEGEVIYIDESLKRFDGTRAVCIGYTWIEEEDHWRYVDINSGAALNMKEELPY